MVKDVTYINGVIAVKETALLGGKLIKMCSATAEEAFRTLTESGFGRGSAARSAFEYEKLLEEDLDEINSFVREYAPSEAEKAYFLAPFDFHNAKALLKSKYTGASPQPMLAPDGLIPCATIARCVENTDYSPLYGRLKEACENAEKLFSNEEKYVSGAEIGVEFSRAEYACLAESCKSNSTLEKFVVRKADMTDILSAFRSKTAEYALNNALFCGKLTKKHIEDLFEDNAQKVLDFYKNSPYLGFVKICLEARENGGKLTRAELERDNAETAELSLRRHELKSKEPFIYYVLRRRAENADLRIIFVCLAAGLGEAEIISHLRGIVK